MAGCRALKYNSDSLDLFVHRSLQLSLKMSKQRTVVAFLTSSEISNYFDLTNCVLQTKHNWKEKSSYF